MGPARDQGYFIIDFLPFNQLKVKKKKGPTHFVLTNALREDTI
jgi:hypothetical protein